MSHSPGSLRICSVDGSCQHKVVSRRSDRLDTTYTTLIVEPGELMIVRLNRPAVRNALNTRMGEELVSCFEQLIKDAGPVRCVILTGEGDKAFCAGGDLKERSEMSDKAWRMQHVVLERLTRALLDCPIPIIGAVNGAAYGGGCEMAACCDFVYAADHARFALPEVTLGILPGGGGTQTMSRAVGERRAKELILTGRTFTAREAHKWGLVNAVFTRAALMDAAKATAARIVANAPISVQQAKQSIVRGLQLSLKDGLAFELNAYNRTVLTRDRHEGLRAFNEKRAPRFEGC